MARRPSLGGGSLNPFGGGGVDFGAFNILDPGREAYLVFLKVETAWQAGHASNDDYLAALNTYAQAQPADSSDRVSLLARLEQTRYQIERNVLTAKIDNGQATDADLVAYDKAKLVGLNQNSEEYVQRLNLYRESQAKWVSGEEKKEVQLYQDGRITTTQLRSWYQGVLGNPLVDNNPDLTSSLTGRIHDLDSRVQDERDTKMVSDFADGKVPTASFIAYATAAKARYGAGTQQANDWQDRITKANQNAGETSLLYRYNLSQQYAELSRFVKSNSGKPAGGTSSSSSTRVVMGADGKWHTVTSTTTKSHAPTAAEQAAYAKVQVEIADAKKQMVEITHKAAAVGGFVPTATVTRFYQQQLGKYARGSSDWYRIQEKLDSLSSTAHQESVYSREGIKITYPSGGGGGSASTGGGGHTSTAAGGSSSGGGGGNYTLAQFMKAIATQESGGRYDARNGTTGAYGKYQILPANWSSWAQKAGLSADAEPTPENQEKVATAAFARLAKSYGNDWGHVAAAWFAGVAGSRNEASWGPKTRRYVAAIMSHLGTTRAAVAGPSAHISGGGAGPAERSGPAASSPYAPALSGAGAGGTHNAIDSGTGPLAIVTSVTPGGPRRSEPLIHSRSTGFPTGLDGRSFERFYANYEHAFENGDEIFVDTTSGKPIAYFVGSDAGERINRMRQLDDLRVSLYDTRAIAYQGTPSELTAANQRNEAYKDVARHEYQIVDTVNRNGPGSAKLGMLTNPLGSGIRLLDKTTAAIKGNLDQAKAAFKRGDLTGAYALLQMAQHTLAANSGTMQLLANYAESSKGAIASIERASGGIDPAEALGADKGASFEKDLARLTSFNTELTDLFTGDKEATDVLAQIKGHVQTDAGGNVIYDTGPNDPMGKLQLKDDSYFHLKGDGSLELLSAPPSLKNGAAQAGQDEKTVLVHVKSGNDVIDVQADWTVGEVGGFIDATGQYHPIMGKKVQQRNADGSWTTFYQNPLAPGTAAGWSAQPYRINAPASFTAALDANGNVTYSFGAPSTYDPHSGAGQMSNGITYKLSFDPKTATYVLLGSKAGGLLDAGYQDAPVPGGVAGLPTFMSLLADAGFSRAATTGDFVTAANPVFGMTESQYGAWQHSYQPSVLPTMSGGLSPDARDEAMRSRSGGLSPDARGEMASSRSGGLSPDARDERATTGGLSPDARSEAARGRSGGLSPDARDELSLARSGGLSPDARDEAARAALPPAKQAAITRSSLPAVKAPPASKRYGSEPATPVPPVPVAVKPKTTKATKAKTTVRQPLPKPVPPPTLARNTSVAS